MEDLMADFTKKTIADMAADHPDINMGTTANMELVDWGPQEDDYWREAYASRPYALADRSYDYYRPAYRYGAESAARHRGREWHEVESELESGWEHARGRSAAGWHEVKHAARDAWDRVRQRAAPGSTHPERSANRPPDER
jgi:hypothetical protein